MSDKDKEKEEGQVGEPGGLPGTASEEPEPQQPAEGDTPKRGGVIQEGSTEP